MTSPAPIRHVSDEERRARLARRHALHQDHRAPTVEAATEAMTALHSTEGFTPYLATWARMPEASLDDINRALYEDRSLVKQLAMRRTLFVFPRDLLPAVWGSASARVAGTERMRLIKDVEASGLASDGAAWLEQAVEAVTDHLSDGVSRPAAQIREQVPQAQGTITVSPGSKWGGEQPITPRVLTLAGARGQIVRGTNAGHWRTSRPQWTSMRAWLREEPPVALPARDGYAEVVRRWLRTFGPGTEADIQWWLGSTKTVVRQALDDLAAARVSLESGDTGWLRHDDIDPEPAVEPWVALLPVLDPTTMGWKQRDFYLASEHVPYLFDSNGNAGSTAWVNGRIVGCWVQDKGATVRVALREDVGAPARAALQREAERLTAWLDGVVINTIYASRQMKAEKLP